MGNGWDCAFAIHESLTVIVCPWPSECIRKWLLIYSRIKWNEMNRSTKIPHRILHTFVHILSSLYVFISSPRSRWIYTLTIVFTELCPFLFIFFSFGVLHLFSRYLYIEYAHGVVGCTNIQCNTCIEDTVGILNIIFFENECFRAICKTCFLFCDMGA